MRQTDRQTYRQTHCCRRYLSETDRHTDRLTAAEVISVRQTDRLTAVEGISVRQTDRHTDRLTAVEGVSGVWFEHVGSVLAVCFRLQSRVTVTS